MTEASGVCAARWPRTPLFPANLLTVSTSDQAPKNRHSFRGGPGVRRLWGPDTGPAALRDAAPDAPPPDRDPRYSAPAPPPSRVFSVSTAGTSNRPHEVNGPPQDGPFS